LHHVVPLWASLIMLLIIAFIWPQFWQLVQRRVDRWFYRGRYDALKALESFSHETQSFSDPGRLASIVVQLITNALNTKSTYLLLLNRLENVYETIARRSEKENAPATISVKSSSLLVKWLDRYGTMLLVQDMEIFPQLQALSEREKQALNDIKASLVVPLKLTGQPLFGMLILGPKRSDTSFTLEDKQLLSTISNQMAMKLNNLQLYTDILKSREDLQSWFNIMPDCIIVISSDKTIEYMNHAAIERFGNRTGELYGSLTDGSADGVEYTELSTDIGGTIIHRIYTRIDGKLYDIQQASFTEVNGSVSIVKILRDITKFKQTEAELKLRALLLDSATDAIFLYDRTGNFKYVNGAACKILGYSKEELLQIRYEDLLVSGMPDIPPQRKKTSRKSYISFETHLKHKNGNIIPVEIHSSSISSNEVKYYLAVVRDITMRISRDQEIRESREKLMQIFQHVSDGITVTDMNGIFIDVNDRVLQLHGFSSKNDIIGKHALHYIAPYDHERVNKSILQLYQKGKGTLEIDLLKKDGSAFKAEASASVLRNAQKEPVGVINVVRDITERKRAEEELKMRALLLDNASDAIALFDLDGNLIYVNKTAHSNFGYNKEELMQMDVYDILVIEDEQKPDLYKTEFLNKGYLSMETVIRHQNGHVLPVEINVSTVVLQGNMYALAIVRDISERKKAEEERKLLERKAQLASQLASVGEMAAGIAHEINNPLTSVIGYAQLLMKQNIPEDLKEEIGIIHEGAQRVSGIVNRMLTFARQRKPKREYVAINEIIEATLELRQYSLRNNNIEVILKLDPDLPMTIADNGQLQQVFLNIIVNAETEMKLAHGKGTLIISTSVHDNTINMAFTDDGPGIPEKHLSRVFDPFFTTREVGQGTGLGLSVCHGIISEHGGSISVKNESNKGVTFTVELPIVTDAGIIENEEIDSQIPPDTKKAKILIVDDEETIRHYLSRLLTGEGYSVETVENAAKALEIVRQKRFNLILLDVKMPVMSGTDLYVQLRDIAKSLAKRVLFITGDVMGEDTYKFFAETKTPYITKPFNDNTLIEKIRSMLG
jgi:PAS domain S-box-containing protein